jgi:hypothetical protein
MSTQTINPTAFTNPDQGGTTAFGSASNTGGSSGANASFSDTSGGDAESDSCRWHGFTYSGPQPIALKLKLTWSASGSTNLSFAVGGTGSTLAQATIEYSINGGANWLSFAGDSASLSGAGSDSFNVGSTEVSVNLSPTTTISNIQVRARIDADVSFTAGEPGNSADADVSISIGGISLEITTQDGSPILLI